ncbi:putative membrane-anchored protein [Desulfosporosinus acidiphilus SJ4]|uniref:Putative membrane-anchored protein n=1 Tax=Desulfosporosinus acidiphilus (strain DSM 22704 / JCM 16185 / SJ4) TaxID=646529 RepID=I4D346_DESAJ|nr:GDYXXLXY domain-containing protein [Desulfosporosinus acidiphilus]AFM40220.1 putative membrane-anchored protein [Desulfosporosinus acidiphilus SJ4]
MTKKKSFLLAAAIPLLILVAMTIKPEATVLFGREIFLETRAVDPTDLFRGDYVSVNLAIAEIPKSMAPEPIEKLRKRTLYVSLKQDGKFYVVDQVSVTKPQQGVYLKGRIRNSYSPLSTFQVDYSLDRYFVKQGSGQDLEHRSHIGGLVGTVKVLGGYGVITGLAQP